MFSDRLDDRNRMAESIKHFGHFWLSTTMQNSIAVAQEVNSLLLRSISSDNQE
jgi:hypothetical protein